MTTTINFYRKNVYGVENIYIENKEQSSLISSLTGRKTINSKIMQDLTQLAGIIWNEVIAPR